jgi:hypothetical protein
MAFNHFDGIVSRAGLLPTFTAAGRKNDYSKNKKQESSFHSNVITRNNYSVQK